MQASFLYHFIGAVNNKIIKIRFLLSSDQTQKSNKENAIYTRRLVYDSALDLKFTSHKP